MDKDKEELYFNFRYAQRLCQRTARLYRRIQTSLTFMSLLAGSSAVATLAAQLPAPSAWLLATFAALGCINLAAPALQQLLDEARQTDTTEVEQLRPVAYNDVVLEIDEPDFVISLTPMQKIMGALA